MKQDNELKIPVGVSLTHDHGNPIIFAYVGGGRGRLGMKAKRFNPRVIGSLERGTQASHPLEKASPEGTHGSGGSTARTEEAQSSEDAA